MSRLGAALRRIGARPLPEPVRVFTLAWAAGFIFFLVFLG